MFLIQNMRIADAYELAARNDSSDVSFFLFYRFSFCSNHSFTTATWQQSQVQPISIFHPVSH